MELSFEIRELTECIVGTLLIEAVKKLTYLEHEEIAILYAKGFQWETTIKELFALESVMQEVDALLRETLCGLRCVQEQALKELPLTICGARRALMSVQFSKNPIAGALRVLLGEKGPALS